MNKMISNFVLFCSGVNVKFLYKNCPNDRHRFYPIGLGVIVTASLAFIAMLFASHSIFNVESLAGEIVLVLFSLFWGLAIFMIDWGLIKSMPKPKFHLLTFASKLKYFLPVLFRLVIALIISYSISRPMEVKIYENRLKAQIEKNRQDFVTREMKLREADLDIIKTGINDNISSEESLLKMRNADPQTEAFAVLLDEKKKLDKEFDEIKKSNEKKMEANLQAINRIYNSDKSYSLDSLNVRQFMHQWAKNRIITLNKVNATLSSEIKEKENEAKNLIKKIEDQESEYKAGYDALLTSAKNVREENQYDLTIRQKQDSIAMAEIIQASYLSFNSDHPGLITQLEALSNFEKTPEGESAKAVRLILLLVIICIDTAPIVFKLLTKRGAYEEFVEDEEDVLKFLSRQKKMLNKLLIQKLTISQKDKVDDLICRWDKQEKEEREKEKEKSESENGKAFESFYESYKNM